MMKRPLRALVCCAMLWGGGFAASAQDARTEAAGTLSLPAIFGDHMVLQQGKDLPVWGKATPGKTVRVTVAERTGEATAEGDGKWRVRLEPMAVKGAWGPEIPMGPE